MPVPKHRVVPTDRMTIARAIFFNPDQIAGEGRDSFSVQLQKAVLVMPGLPEGLRSYRIVRPASISSPPHATQGLASTQSGCAAMASISTNAPATQKLATSVVRAGGGSSPKKRA